MSRALRYPAWAAVAALAALVAAPVWAQVPPPADRPVAPQPAEAEVKAKAIDLVICLDVSGSMNGLIESAKIRLWDIVNEMARLKPIPNLRVALYSYGATAYPADKGWVRKEVDLTEDLDDVYKALTALHTGGGDEYVARVSKTALDDQKWSTDKDALKLIFVCGNEAVDQDRQVPLADVASLAKKSGVVVNTIYCGPNADGIAPGWSKFAGDCGGRYMNIDMNKATTQVAVKTEFDTEIVKLGEDLNKTYVVYGKEGKARAENQVAQDANALKANAAGTAPTAALGRAECKANGLYNCPTWDLVDKMKEKDFDLAKMKDEDLPDELKKLKPEERLEYLKKKSAERAELQKKINDLSAKRQKKVDEELAKLPKSDAEKALDEAVKTCVREQAAAKGFAVPAERK